MKIISALVLLRLSGLKEDEISVEKIKNLLLKLGDVKVDEEWIELVREALSGDHLRQIVLQGLSNVKHLDFDLENLKELDKENEKEEVKEEAPKQLENKSNEGAEASNNQQTDPSPNNNSGSLEPIQEQEDDLYSELSQNPSSSTLPPLAQIVENLSRSSYLVESASEDQEAFL